MFAFFENIKIWLVNLCTYRLKSIMLQNLPIFFFFLDHYSQIMLTAPIILIIMLTYFTHYINNSRKNL